MYCFSFSQCWAARTPLFPVTFILKFINFALFFLSPLFLDLLCACGGICFAVVGILFLYWSDASVSYAFAYFYSYFFNFHYNFGSNNKTKKKKKIF